MAPKTEKKLRQNFFDLAPNLVENGAKIFSFWREFFR